MDRLEGPIDLKATLESGQLFHWRRAGAEDAPPDAEGPLYETTVGGNAVRLWQVGDDVAYEGDAPRDAVRRLLGLGAPLEAIVDGFDDAVVEQAAAATPGLRVVSDDPWRSLVSFLCSPQSSVDRIRRLVNRIADAYGDPLSDAGVSTFPDATTVAAEATEEELRSMNLGYRAPYVLESARTVADGSVALEAVTDLDYQEAHAELQRLHGVGDKVADCVLLFGLGFTEAVPIDRWMWRVLEEHYPELATDDYVETGERFRDRFGEHAGYAQNFLFHQARTDSGGLPRPPSEGG